jgi:hypothetical protein
MPEIASLAPPVAGASAVRCGGILTVDLTALAANFRSLVAWVGSATCAAVVKANAYGLGAARVAPALAAAGCRDFFVAHVDEGIAYARSSGRVPGSRSFTGRRAPSRSSLRTISSQF